MRKRGIPLEYTEWLKWCLDGRKTTLAFDNFISEIFGVGNGIDQGCPLSVIISLFYNADLLDIVNRKKGELSLGFIDDTLFAARGRSFVEANEKVKAIMEKEGGGTRVEQDAECGI
ncbi:hypothetical protein BV22DRAFT_1025622 [Leucogyrophana mollusca]|uniref:Uncharacterized protein n=1 Tax=Leucogyrophana mollusca TaxID=85980 RepID=A0ACB8AX83_9AGAM|nr:hypothetical protein BV22DRAFT_1025622 [Leucogyrophana mollusca]